MLPHECTSPAQLRAYRHANPPGSCRVAREHAPPDRGLSRRSGFAHHRAVRFVIAVASCCPVHPHEHCGGVWAPSSGGAAAFPVNRRGIAQGAANASRGDDNARIPVQGGARESSCDSESSRIPTASIRPNSAAEVHLSSITLTTSTPWTPSITWAPQPPPAPPRPPRRSRPAARSTAPARAPPEHRQDMARGAGRRARSAPHRDFVRRRRPPRDS